MSRFGLGFRWRNTNIKREFGKVGENMNIFFYGVKDAHTEEIESLFQVYAENRVDEIFFNTVTNPEEIVTQHRKNQIYFCVPEYAADGISGIEFAKLVRKRNTAADILFLSANNLSAISILKKFICPTGYFLFDEIPEAVNYMINILMERDEEDQNTANTIEIISQYEKIAIPVENIVYFVTYNKKIMCKLVDGKNIKFYGTLGQIEKEYTSFFIRCHAGYLVNKKKVLQVHLSKNYLEVINDEILPISRKYRLDVKKYLDTEKPM